MRQLRGDLEVLQYRTNTSTDSLTPRPTAIVQPPPAATPPRSQVPGPTLRYDTSAPAPQPSLDRPLRSLSQRAATPAEEEAYSLAFDDLRSGRYEQAVDGFLDFIARYPDSPLAGDAYYWLGESYYVMRDFSLAQQAFLNLGTQYPNSEKVPDTLLKLGYIYSETGDNQRALEVLERLVASYPESQAANLAEKRLRLLR